ncbi:MAG TPA: hypothetical protein VFF09_05455 [archaeon]|nr:hypothetical protein [archaeon]
MYDRNRQRDIEFGIRFQERQRAIEEKRGRKLNHYEVLHLQDEVLVELQKEAEERREAGRKAERNRPQRRK